MGTHPMPTTPPPSVAPPHQHDPKPPVVPVKTRSRGRARTDHDKMMLGVAQRRGIVRLDTGQILTLVCWGGNRGGNRCRVESQDGETRRTLKKTEVVEVIDAREES